MKPRKVSDNDAMFGATYIAHLIPDISEIKKVDKKWNRLFNEWFFKGLNADTELVSKLHIDKAKALRHISAIMRSMTPSQEDKEAAVSFLLSEWFEDVKENI